MELARPTVVAETRPEGQDLVDPGRGESLDRRKAREEALVVGEDHLHPRLLQHDFGKPDPIRVARAAPGEVAVVPVEPAEEILRRRRHRAILSIASQNGRQ
jgi:hypothetical protein